MPSTGRRRCAAMTLTAVMSLTGLALAGPVEGRDHEPAVRFRVVNVIPRSAYTGRKPQRHWTAFPERARPPMSREIPEVGDPAVHRAMALYREAMRLAEIEAETPAGPQPAATAGAPAEDWVPEVGE